MVPWDKYEIALLVETYFNIENGIRRRGNELKRLSVKLRRMALNRGMAIDSVYRNYNGMNCKVRAIGEIIGGAPSDGMPQQKEFAEIVKMYLDSPGEYALLLEEAHKMCAASLNGYSLVRAEFKNWLKNRFGLDERAARETLGATERLSLYSVKKGLTSLSVWTGIGCKELNRIKQALEKDAVLKRKFPEEHAALERAVKYYSAFAKEYAAEKSENASFAR